MLSASEALTKIADLVAHCGGRLDVDTTITNGISLSVFLPANPPDTESAARILVVDDDPKIGQFVADILTAVGYRVVRAMSGDEALKLCGSEGEEIDLLISDVVMPHMSGRKLASELGQRSCSTKVLLMSGYPNLTAVFDGVICRAESVKVECNFLQKPFSPNELLSQVSALLPLN